MHQDIGQTTLTNLLRSISTYRTQIMALATIGVLFTHLPARFETFAIARMMLLGIMGVDVFFFVSGFGLYYSFHRDPSPRRFYAKRIRRILPTFLILLVVHLLWSGTWSWTKFLRHASTLGFWIPAWKWGFFGWYVSAILLCYLIFPLIYAGLHKRPWLTTIFVSVIGLMLCGSYAYYFLMLHPHSYNCFILFFGRIPVFALGALCGLLSQRPSLPRPRLTRASLIVVAIIVFVCYNLLISHLGYAKMRNSGLLFLLPALIIPGFCIAVTDILQQVGRFVNAILVFIGTATLEIYLLLGDVYSLKTKTTTLLHIDDNRITALLLLIACILLAYTAHRIIQFLQTHVSFHSCLQKRVKKRIRLK